MIELPGAASPPSALVEVVVATPAHSGLGERLTYRCDRPLPPGTLVRVPLGSREVLGIVWDAGAEPSACPPARVRPVSEVWDALPPLDGHWRALVAFAARYYQRALGEVALAALPPALRELTGAQLQRRLMRVAPVCATPTPSQASPWDLTPAQAEALAAIETSERPVLLFGATGSGKTEVYLQATARLLARDPQAQALVLVPEINLTPQLEQRFRARFGDAVTTLHSRLPPAQRLRHWLAAHRGQARVVLGTRMAVFASLPRLRLIVVDEEHDPSYKSQEGARYSARDLAVYRARLGADVGCRVVLGSATPALESWHAADSGRYHRVVLADRMG
ncbi:MAG: DEAD/DEAH box helicase, partial [Tepidimonas sp.]|uniref:DEAD/DEAH box helicase n=1 Tax=Tepidimonas sp. TaxID=2002775 RepID=UPI004054A736